VHTFISSYQNGLIMNDICTYLIHISGQVDEGETNAMSPQRIAVERIDPDATLLTACTDQSGLMGLLRHLHGLGYILLSITREPTN
jgi:hypothetical protein